MQTVNIPNIDRQKVSDLIFSLGDIGPTPARAFGVLHIRVNGLQRKLRDRLELCGEP
jgi:hypothetical protein